MALDSTAVQTPAAGAPTSTPAVVAAPIKTEGHYKETIEQILVAFILAFIFRAFVVEAFVIPTGSMAPTLMGAHMRFRCEDCGYEFDVNYPVRGNGEDVEIPKFAEGKVYNAHCPNCGYQVGGTTAPPVHYGDRILVLKYLYLFQPPQRWDVVVFKSPDDQKYAQNFIKRLVGLPGESIMVLDGDVYKGAAGESVSAFKIEPKSKSAQRALWRVVNDNDFLPVGKNGSREWRQPWKQTDGTGWTLTDRGRASRIFSFKGSDAGAITFDPAANRDTHALTEWLAYDVGSIDDRIAMRFETPQNTVSDLKLKFFYQRHSGSGPLRAQLTKLDQTFTAEIADDAARLWRRIGEGTGPDDLGQELSSTTSVPKMGPASPLEVEFMNVDYRVTLRLNGHDVLSTRPDQYHPDLPRLLQAYKLRQKQPMPAVRIQASAQECSMTHLSLWRDIYYTNRDIDRQSLPWATPDNPVDLHTAAPGRSFTARVEGVRSEKGSREVDVAADEPLLPGQQVEFPGDSTIYHVSSVAGSTLRLDPSLAADVPRGATIRVEIPATENEYFVLGDNSLVSGDARYWRVPIRLPGEALQVEAGRVPERFVLGKAFFVYWPAGYRPFSPNLPGIIPNFGDMRFIH